MHPPDSQSADELFRRGTRQPSAQSVDPYTRLAISPGWTWWLLWGVVAVLVAALALSVLGRVEVTARAPAILRPGAGARVLAAQVAGTVRTVRARPGQTVHAGDAVFVLDAPALEGELLQSRREVDLLGSDRREVARRRQQLHEEQAASARVRIEQSQAQTVSLEASVNAYESKWQSLQSLSDSGVVSRMSVVDAHEAFAQATRQLSSARQALAQARQDLSILSSQHDANVWQDEQALRAARARQDALRLNAAQTVVRAARAGTVESLVVERGDVVSPGMVLARLVPADAPQRVVSFLAEKDRAFVRVGDEVRLELEQLPYGVYGSLGARVVRIGSDLATATEINEALANQSGPARPAYRVELQITDARAAREAGIRLRSGMLMQARFTLRRQRPLAMLMEPIARWWR